MHFLIDFLLEITGIWKELGREPTTPFFIDFLLNLEWIWKEMGQEPTTNVWEVLGPGAGQESPDIGFLFFLV